MPTDRSLGAVALVAVALLTATTLGCVIARPASALQIVPTPPEGGGPPAEAAGGPLFVDAETRVRSVRFSFSGTRTLDDDLLEEVISLGRPRFLDRMRKMFAFLPWIAAPPLELFRPLVLQRDLVRLRNLYTRSGFPEAELDYDVGLDAQENVVAVTFLIEEGPPTTLGEIRVMYPDGEVADPALPEAVADSVAAGQPETVGNPRFSQAAQLRLENEVEAWFRGRGHPWVDAWLSAADTVSREVAVEVSVRPGPRAWIDTILVEGNERLSRRELVRELPFRAGDLYDSRRVAEGEREVYGLDQIRRSLIDIVEDQPQDSTVALRLRVEEGPPRLLWGRLGYSSASGLAAEAHWSHRAFLGSPLTLTTSAVAETGIWVMDPNPVRQYGVSAALRIPYLGHRRVSGTIGPFVRRTEGVEDTSNEYGVDVTAVYQASALHTISLEYSFSKRDLVRAFPLTSVADLIARGPEEFSPRFLKSSVGLDTSFGTLDDLRTPDRGYLLKADASVTTPFAADLEYYRVGFQGMWAQPVATRVSLIVRATGGRLVPFGRSLTSDPEETMRVAAGLRDVMFSAGGPSDVRGWTADLLGPKIPDVRFDLEGNPYADRYTPVGGLARLTGSLELVLPFPWLHGEHRTYVFLDGGKVWSTDQRFRTPDPELIQDEWFYATGGGVQVATPVGPVRLGIGYKLNASLPDLLYPNTVLAALASGTPLTQREPESRRRWVLHLSLGRTL